VTRQLVKSDSAPLLTLVPCVADPAELLGKGTVDECDSKRMVLAMATVPKLQQS
jgi:hypothetical protein